LALFKTNKKKSLPIKVYTYKRKMSLSSCCAPEQGNVDPGLPLSCRV